MGEKKDFTGVRLGTLRSDSNRDFDVYVSFKNEYIKYIPKGSEKFTQKITKLKKAGMNPYVYILREDMDNYRFYLEGLAKEALKQKDLGLEEKAVIASGIFAGGFDYLFSSPEDPSAYIFAQRACNIAMDFMVQNEGLLKAVFSCKWDGPLLNAHAFKLSLLASRFALALGKTEAEAQNICLAGCLHGLALLRSGANLEELLPTPLENFPPKELQKFKAYPQGSKDYIAQNPEANKDVLDLIYHHEEKISGKGLMGKDKLDPCQEVLALIQCFSKKINYYGMSFKEAIKDMQLAELGNFDFKLTNKLKKLLAMENLEEL